MAREKGWKGKESRERLLAAAIDEFANQGFHKTKVSTIVTRAGLTQPAFYLYFSSKEAIFDEVVNDFHERLRMMMKTIRMEPGIETEDVPKRVLFAVETLFRFLAENPNLTRIGLFQTPEAKKIKEELAFMVVENLRAEQQAGYFHPDLSMEIVAECLVGIVERLTVSQLFSKKSNAESLAAQVVHLLMYGMFAHGSVLREKP
ncbi:TetR family transcriptional regulator [Aneurinibacillus migulanus]|uniref:TetR family transcriptional regulator n=1 Tax=Aneurinibacillus migulanus TaxID=47500 RepID=A0A0D1WJR9_ANEMI|nr:TetR/AcrR family transcriptional regulator [Aneurinibacillus migulanus]KIV49905.1 TetR family transcriptional regulator [Aneurinibacillus migulanus]KIV58865.1 TetR family transcriptional regulator [Aneurinibacillus migulanus]KON96557.1 TetR family transcriptional regulator [Aneurinibacillus migulanus]KPD09054.1 TetR family transcriptional regulator [Aneurinibacillus migulanus]MED0890774.1 TetR/AcrR family transcriptional regulator [Aneurinibacillus migulanus]